MKKLTVRLFLTASVFGFATVAQAQDSGTVKVPEPMDGAMKMSQEAPKIEGAPEGMGEEAKKAMENAADKAEEAIKDAAGEVGDAMENAADKVGDAVEAVTEEQKPAEGEAAEDAATDMAEPENAAGAIELPEPPEGAAEMFRSAPVIGGEAAGEAAGAMETPAASEGAADTDTNADTGAATAETPPAAADGAPAAPAESAAAAPSSGADTHTIASGDTLWDIAKAVYGDGRKWTMIQEANPGIRSHRLKIGETLAIPAN